MTEPDQVDEIEPPDVLDLTDEALVTPPPPTIVERRERTRGRIVGWLLVLLAATTVGNIAVALVVSGDRYTRVDATLNSTLTAVAALTGTAIGWYFSDASRRP